MTNQSASETQQPASQARFFGWLRSLGVVRDNGWLGGVCGGIAERIGVDPIIVRGIAVVAAILGGPAFLFYAIAWALLPDRDDHIHFERMLRGIFDPASVAIIVFAVLAFAPLVQGVWWAGFPVSGVPVVSGIIRLGWTLLVIGLIIAFVVWAARGFPGGPWRNGTGNSRPSTTNLTFSRAPAASAAPTDGSTSDPGAAAANGASGEAMAASTAVSAGSVVSGPSASEGSSNSTLGDSAPADASAAELEEWKQRQAAWKAERDAFARQQELDRRALRDQRVADNRAAAIARSDLSRSQRERERMMNPRTSGAYVFATIGLAIVAGSVMAIVSGAHTVWSGYEQTAGLAVATLVFGLSIIVAGFLRRRSGFLTFVSILLVLATIGSAFAQANAHHLLTSFS